MRRRRLRPKPKRRTRRPLGLHRPARYAGQARSRLRRFRGFSLVAVGATGLLLLLLEKAAAVSGGGAGDPGEQASESVEEATGVLRDLVEGFLRYWPKILVAIGVLVVGGLLARLVHAVMRRALRSWERGDAIGTTGALLLWLVSFGAALSILAGDVRALVGSVGLVGLALSWALQSPIESFAGWVLNSLRGYYRVGDRIEVGEVFGDVYRIDLLTTTVWEAGGTGKPVQAAQPTGGLVTFPNSELLRASIVNYTRDFPYLWDELTVAVTSESDLDYSMALVRRVAEQVVGQQMGAPAEEYSRLLEREHVPGDVAVRPEVFASAGDSWTNVTVRYLVPARERRRWSSDLLVALSRELSRPEHDEHLQVAVPRSEFTLLGGERCR